MKAHVATFPLIHLKVIFRQGVGLDDLAHITDEVRKPLGAP